MVIYYQDGSSPDVCKMTRGGFLYEKDGYAYFIPFEEMNRVQIGQRLSLNPTQIYDPIEKIWVKTDTHMLIGSVVSGVEPD